MFVERQFVSHVAGAAEVRQNRGHGQTRTCDPPPSTLAVNLLRKLQRLIVI